MTGNLVILYTVFITTEQFGYIETQFFKKSTYFIGSLLKTFLRLLNCISGEKSEFRTVSKGHTHGEKIILASTVFYLWIIMFKMAYFEHPSEGKKCISL